MRPTTTTLKEGPPPPPPEKRAVSRSRILLKGNSETKNGKKINNEVKGEKSRHRHSGTSFRSGSAAAAAAAASSCWAAAGLKTGADRDRAPACGGA